MSDKPDWTTQKAAELLPCSCPKRRIEREGHYGACLTWRHERVASALREARAEPMLALESLTPGGSEFVGDVQRCVAHVKEQQRRQHELIVKFKKERDGARAEGYEAGIEAAAKEICDGCQEEAQPAYRLADWWHGSAICSASAIRSLLPTKETKNDSPS